MSAASNETEKTLLLMRSYQLNDAGSPRVHTRAPIANFGESIIIFPDCPVKKVAGCRQLMADDTVARSGGTEAGGSVVGGEGIPKLVNLEKGWVGEARIDHRTRKLTLEDCRQCSGNRQ